MVTLFGFLPFVVGTLAFGAVCAFFTDYFNWWGGW